MVVHAPRGVLSRVEDAPLDLLTDWPSRLRNARLKIVQECAQNYIREKKLCPWEGNEIHYVNALRNYVAHDLEIPTQDDMFARQDIDWERHLNPFWEEAKAAINISSVVNQLTQVLLTPFGGDFSYQNKFKELQNLGKELNLLKEDSYLIQNIKHDSKREEEAEDICKWIFEEDEEGECKSRSPEEISFIIQRTLITRLIAAGYLEEKAIIPISLDEQYQFILVPTDIDASWIQSNEACISPQSLEKFLEKKPGYREQIEAHLKPLFHEQSQQAQNLDDLLKILSRLPAKMRFLFLCSIEEKLSCAMSEFDSSAELINWLSKIIVSLLPQDYANFLNLVSIKNALIPLSAKLETTRDLVELLNSVPKDVCLFFLQAMANKLPQLMSINLAIITIIQSLPKEHCAIFLRFAGIKEIFTKEFETLLRSLKFLKEDARWSFVQKIIEVLPDLPFKLSNFIEIKDLLPKEHHAAFLTLLNTKYQLITLVNDVSDLKCVLSLFSERDRLPFLQGNQNTWLKLIHTYSDFSNIIKCLPGKYRSCDVFKVTG